MQVTRSERRGAYSVRVVDGSNGFYGQLEDPGSIGAGRHATIPARLRIQTDRGLVPAAALKPGDRISGLDGQGRTLLASLRAEGLDLGEPILVRKGALGAGRPARDLVLSPAQRICLRSDLAVRLFGSVEVLVRVEDLLHLDGVERTGGDDGAGVVLVFDAHALFWAEGLLLEAYAPDLSGVRDLPDALESALHEALPRLRYAGTCAAYRANCPVLDARECRMLTRGDSTLGRERCNLAMFEPQRIQRRRCNAPGTSGRSPH